MKLGERDGKSFVHRMVQASTHSSGHRSALTPKLKATAPNRKGRLTQIFNVEDSMASAQRQIVLQSAARHVTCKVLWVANEMKIPITKRTSRPLNCVDAGQAHKCKNLGVRC